MVRDKEGHKRRRLALQAEVNRVKHLCGCEICGTHEGRLEFHHPDGVETKYNRISNIQTRRRLIQELDKVVVRCAICHRVQHAADRERDVYGRFLHC